MIVGVGIDVVGIERFAAAAQRTPALVERLFHPTEITRPDGSSLGMDSLAARFAVKEAVAKVLVSTRGMLWTDCRVLTGPQGDPQLEVHGAVAQAAEDRGIAHWHISISHDAGIAAAVVVAEGRGSR